MAKPNYTLIVPVLDEGAALDAFFSRLFKISEVKSAQVIIADGGSVDNTRDIVFSWQKKRKNLEWVECPKGKGIALRIGFGKATGKSIIFIDADLQYPPEEIRKVIKALKSCDLVVTKRKTAPLDHRRILSLGFSRVIGKGMLNLPASDPQSGLKGIRAGLLSRLTLSSRNWELDAELIRKAQAAGAKIKEVEIEFLPRIAGKSKTGLVSTSANLFAGSMGLFFERNMPKAG